MTDDAGRELIRQRGNSTYQGDKLAEITEITELNVELVADYC